MTGVHFRSFGVELTLDLPPGSKVPLAQSLEKGECIPGPTLKGAFRGAVEEHFERLAGKGAKPLTPCVPVPQASAEEKAKISNGLRRQACSVKVSDKSVVVPVWNGRRGVCPACTLFGAQGLVGFIRCGFLRRRGNGFTGQIRVLWEDESRGWRFGKPREVQGTRLDILSDDDPERFLQYLVQLLRNVKALGASPKRNAAGSAEGRVRVRELTVREL